MAVEIAPRIVVDSAIHFGKPVIKGTRVSVDVLIGKLASGMSEDEVADEYEVTIDDTRLPFAMPPTCSRMESFGLDTTSLVAAEASP